MTLTWFKLRSGTIPSTEKALNRKENPKETRQAGSQSGSFKKVGQVGPQKKVKEAFHIEKKT